MANFTRSGKIYNRDVYFTWNISMKDDNYLAFGNSYETDSYIRFTWSNLTFYDTTVGVTKTLTELAAAGSTKYDDIGNPDASGSIAMWAYTGTYTSSNVTWWGIIMANSHSNPTAWANLLTLKYTADWDAHGIFFKCLDNDTNEMFKIGADWATIITGKASWTDALTLTAWDETISDWDLILTTGGITLTAWWIDIGSDNVNLTLWDSGATDSKIYFDWAGNLTFFDSTAGTATLNQLIASSPTWDFTISNGQFDWTDNTDEVAGTWVFSWEANNDINRTSSITTWKALAITADWLTTWDMIYLVSLAAWLTSGKYIHCYDWAATDFSVAANWLTTIAGSASGTDAFVITAWDILVTSWHIDMTVGDFTSADGSMSITDADNANTFVIVNNTISTADLVDISSTSITTWALMKLNSNAITADWEVLEIISAWDATSTWIGVSVTMSAVAASSWADSSHGIWVDLPEATSWANGIGVRMDKITTADMLKLDAWGWTMTWAGRYINCVDDATILFSVAWDGATVIAGTAAATPALTLSLGDLVITDTDTTTITSVNGTWSIVEIISWWAIWADKACLEIDAAWEFNADWSLLRLSAEGVTATNSPSALQIDCAALDMSAINMVMSPTTNSGIVATTTGILAADKAILELISNASTCNADSSVARFEQTATDGVATCLALKQDDLDIPFITFETTVWVWNAIEAEWWKALTVTHYVMVDIEWVWTRYLQVWTIA